jgi:surfeit locus 1 family protein
LNGGRVEHDSRRSGARLWLFIALAAAAAAVFVRLGFWQLHRLTERRATNAIIASRLDSAVADVAALPHDTSLARYRRVRVTGTPDYGHELIFAARSYFGSPGVELLTPVRTPGRDTAVIVDRGWVYAPDGATIDRAKWRENDTTFTGFAEAFPSTAGATYTGNPGVISRLSYAVVSRGLPYPVAPVYVIELGDSAVAASRVARLSVPPLDEGPHFNYAIQWFAFAAVSIAGAAVVVRQSRQGRSAMIVPPIGERGARGGTN